MIKNKRNTRVTTTSTERLPPHSEEAEVGWLSCALQDPLALNDAEEAGLYGDWFYDLRHQQIYATAWELYAQGGKVDVITLGEKLKSKQLLEQIGGYAYLAQVADLVPSPANAPSYLEILREKWIERMIVRGCTEAVTRVFNSEPDTEQILGKLEADMGRIMSGNQVGRAVSIGESVLPVMEDLEDYHRGHAQIRGLTTGLEYNDKLLCGMGGEHGNYIVLSARPGMGKTSLAMQIALHCAMDHVAFEPELGPDAQVLMEPSDKGPQVKLKAVKGVPVHIFSLEMAGAALCKRMLFQRARADMQRWRTGFAKAQDFPPIIAAAAEFQKAPIWLDDTGRCTIETLKAKARAAFREHKIKLFIVDYIQLMSSATNRRREDRVQELAEISAELANLANKELKVPFIVLAQMNRDYEKDPNRAPRLSDLKDCGSIEQDSDLVGFLYSPKKANDDKDYKAAMQEAFGDDWSEYPSRVNLLWAKNRYGPCGPVQLLFQRSSTLFLDWNVWRKERGLLKPAAGEASLYKPQNQAPKTDDDYAGSAGSFPGGV